MRFLKWVVFILFAQVGYAQLNNTVFEDRYQMAPLDSGKLSFRFLNVNFLRNNEYFNDIAAGYTLFGQQLQPKLAYQPLHNILLEAGVLARMDFGKENFTQVIPTFTFKYQKDSLSFLFGTLEGNVNHRLIEPLYGFERMIKRRAEMGLQLTSNKKRLFTDFWIDWQRPIDDNSDFQEEIYGGLSLNYTIVQKPFLRIDMPFQFTAFHRGGQIGTSKAPLTNLMNAAWGLSLIPVIEKKGWLQGFRIDGYAVLANNFSFVTTSPFKYGSGMYMNLTLNTKWLDIMTSYWLANRFDWFQSGDLYRSVSTVVNYPDSTSFQNYLATIKFNPRRPLPRPPDYTVGYRYREKDRELLILRFMRNFKLVQNIYLTARLEFAYNSILKTTETSQGLYVMYKQEFAIIKPKPR